MKDTYYFQHDYNPTSDPKVQALIGECGAVGYGIYWRIVEMLHEDELHKLQCKKYIYLALAKQMLTSVEQVESIIKNCIDTYELFKTDGDFFWSERVMRNIDKRTELSNKRSKAGKMSAEMRKKSTCVEQLPTSVEQNPTKESKGKEIKGKENKEEENIRSEQKVPNTNTPFEKFNLWLKKEAPNVLKIKNQITEAQFDKLKQTYNSKQIMDIVLNLDNFKDAPKKYTNVNRTVTNWLQRENNKTK